MQLKEVQVPLPSTHQRKKTVAGNPESRAILESLRQQNDMLAYQLKQAKIILQYQQAERIRLENEISAFRKFQRTDEVVANQLRLFDPNQGYRTESTYYVERMLFPNNMNNKIYPDASVYHNSPAQLYDIPQAIPDCNSTASYDGFKSQDNQASNWNQPTENTFAQSPSFESPYSTENTEPQVWELGTQQQYWDFLTPLQKSEGPQCPQYFQGF
jgi:hypothetical protein